MIYILTVEATFEIEAENIVEARRAATRVRTIGEHYGGRYKEHDRYGTRYSVKRISEKKLVRRKS